MRKRMRSPSLDRSSTALVLRWFVVTKHRIPRHVTMSDHEGVIFFPPTDVAPFPAKKSNHIHHTQNFLLVYRGMESGHNPLPFGNRPGILTYVFSSHSVSKIGHAYGQGSGNCPIPRARRSMATQATL